MPAPIRFKNLFGSGPLRSLTCQIKGSGTPTLSRGWVLILAAGSLLGVMSIIQIIHSERTIHSPRDAELATCKQRVRQLMAGGRTEESIQRLTRCLQIHGEKRPNDSEP